MEGLQDSINKYIKFFNNYQPADLEKLDKMIRYIGEYLKFPELGNFIERVIKKYQEDNL